MPKYRFFAAYRGFLHVEHCLHGDAEKYANMAIEETGFTGGMSTLFNVFRNLHTNSYCVVIAEYNTNDLLEGVMYTYYHVFIDGNRAEKRPLWTRYPTV